MAVLEALSEEEKYLLAILTDPSGLDQAEFMWHAPDHEDECFRAWAFQHCFVGETSIITREGYKNIEDCKGTVTVLTESNNGGRGKWVDASVHSFGLQKIWEINVERYGEVKTIRTTELHRWFASLPGQRKRDRTYDQTLTRDLRPGAFFKSIKPHRAGNLALGSYGVVHGICFGDGTRDRSNNTFVNLWGHKQELGRFFSEDGFSITNRPDVAVSGTQYRHLPSYFKDVPSFEESPSYLYSWLSGYFAADGCVSEDGTCSVSSTHLESIRFVRDLCLRLGIITGQITSVLGITSGYASKPTDAHSLTIEKSSLKAEFFLNQSHKQRWLDNSELMYEGRVWKVISVIETDDIEETYCASVPDTHSFVLDGYILTGNSWWRSEHPLSVDQCARSVGKSLSIQVKACAFALNHPAQEMVITAPEGNHLSAVTDLIETRLLGVRLYREMLLGNQNKGITHRPLLVKFRNGARIMGRIPQRTGRGMKGVHPLHLELDEAQDYPPAGFNEVIETLKRGHEGASWRAHGVTRGVEDEFKRITQPGSGWKVFTYTAMSRPTWTEEERQEKIKMYGSADHPDYRRNILGQHGDTQNLLFVLARLAKCFDLDEASDYNQDEYYRVKISNETIDDAGGNILNCIDPPASHQSHTMVWGGMDVGYVKDPSEIMLFSESKAKKTDKETTLKLIARFHLDRVSNPDQVKLVKWIMSHYNMTGFSLDSTGNGLPLFQDLQHEVEPKDLEKIKGYCFSSKIVTGFDETVPLGEFEGNKVDDSAIKKNVLDYSTDVLRLYVDTKRLQMPADKEVLGEFQGQTWRAISPTTTGQERKYSTGIFHALDASRMAALGHSQQPIETFLRNDRKVKKREPTFIIFS